MTQTIQVESTFSAEVIARRIAEIGAQIRADAGWSEVFLLGILKGASFVLADLMRAIPGDVGYGYIDVVRDIADTETATAIEIDFVSYTNIQGRNVCLIKDVVSTGVIENYLLTQLRQHQPAGLKLMALLDRPNLRTVELATDYSIFTVEDGSFVGYGLEHEGRLGNLPFIGKI
ncbi:MAG TPA: phosphoribosyltransferase family protein [Thermoanaerobaculia bacterium]|nr:phosphoribosyltransferase family protein [Thermoanaerobaculia bacterium]